MAAMAREPLRVPHLPPSDNEVGTFLVLWAMDSEEGCFRVAEAVVHVPLLQEYLRLSAAEHRELRLCMGKYCCPVHLAACTNEYDQGPSFWRVWHGLSCLLCPLRLLHLWRLLSLRHTLRLLRLL